jgi:formylglycine-generating enzyme required for sulfatase activity
MPVNPVLAARCLWEGGAQADERTRHKIGSELVARITDPGQPLLARVQAGDALAHLGDPRPGVGVDPATGLPGILLCPVPAGSFLMGSSDADETAMSSEKPQHEVTLLAFEIAKYPVTNVQYGAFVEAGGYDERRYWTEDGWGWRERGGWMGPRDFGAPYNLPNHPVVGVSWYEALAFCRWLTAFWRAEGRIAGDEVVRLPSEAEWEKAARGSDGRRFPWGGDPDPNRANYGDMGIGTSSAAGCFPGGASPYGCLDMAGNVWEWASSLWGGIWGEPEFGYPYDSTDGRENLEAGDRVSRVLRGGSFYDYEGRARCACRGHISPDGRNMEIGFRYAVARFSSRSGL